MRASLLSMAMALAALQATPPVVQRGQAPAGPAGQPAQAAPLDAAQCKCSIEVTVKRQGNGEPISGVDVTVTPFPATPQIQINPAGGAQIVRSPAPPAGTATTTLTLATDSAGHAVFRDLAEGGYLVRAQREGYFFVVNDNFDTQANTSVLVGPANTNNSPAGRGLVPAVNGPGSLRQPMQQLTINLISGGTISGRIQDGNQRPVSGIRVGAYRVIYSFGRRTVFPMGMMAQTDDRGEYRLFWFPPGDYFIRTAANIAQLGRAQSYPTPTYYPGTLDSKLATRIAVHEGEAFGGGDFTLQSGTGATISGTIVNTIPGGVVLPNGQVNRSVSSLFLVPRKTDLVENPQILPNINIRNSGISNDETNFEIRDVPPGTYDFYPIYTVGSGAGSYYTGRTLIEVASEYVTGVKSVIRPGVELKGHLTITGTPPASTRPQPNSSANIRIQMAGKDNIPALIAQRMIPVTPDTDGVFAIKNVTDGSYFIAGVPGLPADAYVSEMRQGARSIYDDNDISVGSNSADPLEVVVTRGGGTIQGIVEDGKHNPVSSIRVALIPDFPRRGNLLLYKTATSIGNGTFNMSGIAPGLYKLFAWEHITQGAEQNAEFMRDYDALGASLTVTPGLATTNIHVPLISK